MATIIRSPIRNPRDTLVCGVASHDTVGLRMLQQSCRRYGIGLTLFGWGQPYPNHNWKLQCQREALYELADDYRHVLFLDVFDSVFVTDLKEIFERFDELETPFVMSAEINCHPPEGPAEDDYPPSPTAYRFVNAGGYLGEMSTIVEILQRFDRPGFSDQPEDQGFWARVFVSGETEMSLDHRNQIFQCLWLAEQDLDYGRRRSTGRRRYANRATQSLPCLIHGNGYCDMDPHYRRLLGWRYGWLRMKTEFEHWRQRRLASAHGAQASDGAEGR